MKKIILILSILFVFCNITNVCANEETASIKTSIKEKFGQIKINKIDIKNIFKSETRTILFVIVCILAVVIFFSTIADNSVGYAIFITVIFLMVMIPTISMSLNEIISLMIVCPFIPVSIVLITIMHLYNINVLRGGWSDFIKEDIPLILGAAAVATLFMAAFIL